MCKYCDGGEDDIYNDRVLSEYDRQAYTGFSVWLEGNEVNILSCFDSSLTRPMLRETKFTINFCPMCGRKLNESYTPSEDAQRCCETCYFHNNNTDQCSNEDSPYDFTLKLFRCNEWCTLEQKMDK